MDFNYFFDSLYILYLSETYSIWRFIFSNFTSSGNMLGGRYYPMGIFTPVYPMSYSYGHMPINVIMPDFEPTI